MVIIRVDDVMCDSSAWNRPRAIRRINAFQRWMKDINQIKYQPTILVSEIQEYPEVVTNLNIGIKEGYVYPMIHGYKHIDYGSLSQLDIEIHLEKCMDWFKKVFDYVPKQWATPWGAKSIQMKNAAKKFDLEVQTTQNTIDVKKAIYHLKNGSNIDIFHNQLILEHWWNRGSTLLKFIDCIKYGSYENAILWDKANREEPIFPQ